MHVLCLITATAISITNVVITPADGSLIMVGILTTTAEVEAVASTTTIAVVAITASIVLIVPAGISTTTMEAGAIIMVVVSPAAITMVQTMVMG